MRKLGSFILKAFYIAYIITAIWLIYFSLVVPRGTPQFKPESSISFDRTQIDSSFYTLGNNWLKENDYGLWEMYLEGEPFERGKVHGVLCSELNEYQEDAFVEQIYKLIPSKSYLRVLRSGIAWFNRDIEKHIPDEYLKEIYGISESADSKYDFIGPAYPRMLNYHAAHDIGHALQNLALVGCTSFSLNHNSTDNNLIIGRNFDFYVNDKFAKNKIVAFVNPSDGYKFMYVTWASFVGVVSGMNEEGLTVTINAAKSTYPTKSADPISLLAREILQYASTIAEAEEIAKSRQTFVSESILIGSAKDNRSAIIEKTPSQQSLFDGTEASLVCANHFQSELFLNDSVNIKDMRESPSVYRQKRCEELIASDSLKNYLTVAKILRDYRGLSNENIGLGNEKAMNQLISHHSVIFMPHQKLVWVSTSPYQLGSYLAYDLNTVFSDYPGIKINKNIYIDSLIIEEDPFLSSEYYQSFELYKTMKSQLQTANFKGNDIVDIDAFADKLISYNPKYYYVYKLLGDYYFDHDSYTKAISMYQKALKLEIEHLNTRLEIGNRLEKSHLNIAKPQE